MVKLVRELHRFLQGIAIVLRVDDVNGSSLSVRAENKSAVIPDNSPTNQLFVFFGAKVAQPASSPLPIAWQRQR
jgi:hypothetical protein